MYMLWKAAFPRAKLCALFMLCFAVTAHAAPKEIVIIRHADKLDQEESGPALSAQGMVRSIQFAFYFLDKFGEPDFLVAADDQKENGKGIAIRSIQTVAPLANMMQIRHPESDYPILHKFPSDSYALLASHLLHDPEFEDKRVVVCWSHQRIPKLAQALGVQEDLPSWPKYDYDSVFYLQYNRAGDLVSFKELRNQFPVSREYSWAGLRDKLMKL